MSGNGAWSDDARLEMLEHKAARALDQAETNWARLQVLEGQLRTDRDLGAQTLALVREGAEARANILEAVREQGRRLDDIADQVGVILRLLRG